jgi:hypothetical protein
MSPANIAGMVYVNGLRIAALTDHNTCGNCAAFMRACEAYGVIAVPGMELHTAEEVHMICLFPGLDAALAFDRQVDARRIRVKNRPEIFGDQLLMDSADAVLGTESDLLTIATALSIEEAYELVLMYGGAAYPAHIDREANGILAMLGAMPERPDFPAVEFTRPDGLQACIRQYGLESKRIIRSSDAHHLHQVQEAEHSIRLDAAGDAQRVREALIRAIRGEDAGL